MALGRNDLKQFALPAYWDAATLEKYRLADGYTYDQLVADIGRGLAIQNAALMADPIMASLLSLTTEIAIEYRVGASNGFQTHTEYARPDPKRGATSGHMLPLIGYDRGLGWTWDFLRKARQIQIDADISDAMTDLRNVFEQKVLTRLFKSTYDSVGSSGRSMPLADGGTADANYIPTPFPSRGGTFAYTHNHITNLNGITQTNLETAVANLWEHGYDAPYDLLIARVDIASWANVTNVTGWTPRADPLIQYGNQVDIARVDTSYIAAIQTDYGAVRVRATGRIPTAYWALYKSYGNGDQRNPLVMRYDENTGFGATLMRGDHIREYPLEDAILFLEFGAGVMDRVGAVVVYNNAGAYTDPTIS